MKFGNYKIDSFYLIMIIGFSYFFIFPIYAFVYFCFIDYWFRKDDKEG